MKTLLDEALPVTAKEDGDNLLVHTYQDVESHLKYAADCRREDWDRRGQFGKRAEFRRTMSVPFNILLQICQKLQIPAGEAFAPEHQARIARELKGPDYTAFRTTSDKRI